MQTKIINNYPNYCVSDNGVIWNSKTGLPLKQQITSSSINTKRGEGYCRVELWKRSKGKKFFVHRIVAEHFIPKSENCGNFVNHINGIKSDNNINNLEWVTHRQNVDHAMDIGLQPKGEKVGTSIYKEDQIHLACKLLKEGDLCMADIADLTGLGYATVADLKYKRSWKHISTKY